MRIRIASTNIDTTIAQDTIGQEATTRTAIQRAGDINDQGTQRMRMKRGIGGGLFTKKPQTPMKIYHSQTTRYLGRRHQKQPAIPG
jgi:translation initiation factor 2 gamma subunit (eIF-2gamma)